MKKAIIVILCSVFLLATKSQAQVFITSFGVTHHWGVPSEVYYTVDHQYHGYDWVHTRRIVDCGRVSFEVILQRGDLFVSVNLDSFGRINRRVANYYYPLNQHVCNDFCGYHTNYYASHVNACNSHHHHGHNHIVYTPPRPVKYYHAPQGNAQGYAKSNGNHDRYRNNAKREPSRVVYADRPTSVSRTNSNRSAVASTSSRSRTSGHVSRSSQSRSRSSNATAYRSRKQ